MDPRIHAVQPPLMGRQTSIRTEKETSASFKNALEEAAGLKISKHAEQRLKTRNISIAPSSWEQISAKMQEAETKGVTDSLVLTNEAALIVSTKNRTVVTAMNREETQSQIFTNINGTIFINE
ncbi:flagellar protein [Halobacillus kuroshimensis]|uniref:Flagellar protein n=1 Tax=Halobacillus kuroshimensis TaxID=302481 RepID=A0ABS3DSX8_9BACI|nr:MULTISPECIES: TIGR02530 family flagellar biosynthesis protein [Halobacillus]MBN8234455.1 flagellar protein [Halobacillus kuroshimensis]